MRALIVALVLSACGGHPHPTPPPPFDAAGLAAELDRVMSDLAAATARLEGDCPRMLDEIERILVGAKDPIDRARAAEADPERAKQLTTAMRSYDDRARGRSDAIAIGLAVCFRQHRELQDRVQRVVDSMPSL